MRLQGQLIDHAKHCRMNHYIDDYIRSYGSCCTGRERKGIRANSVIDIKAIKEAVDFYQLWNY